MSESSKLAQNNIKLDTTVWKVIHKELYKKIEVRLYEQVVYA